MILATISASSVFTGGASAHFRDGDQSFQAMVIRDSEHAICATLGSPNSANVGHHRHDFMPRQRSAGSNVFLVRDGRERRTSYCVGQALTASTSETIAIGNSANELMIRSGPKVVIGTSV